MQPWKKKFSLSEKQRLQMQAAIVEARIQQKNVAVSAMSEHERQQFYKRNLAQARQEDLRYYALTLSLWLLFACVGTGLLLGGVGLYHLLAALKDPLSSTRTDWGYSLLLPVGGIILAAGMQGLAKE